MIGNIENFKSRRTEVLNLYCLLVLFEFVPDVEGHGGRILEFAKATDSPTGDVSVSLSSSKSKSLSDDEVISIGSIAAIKIE